MKLVNLTPHAVRICNQEEKILLEIPPSGQVARVAVEREPMFPISVDGVHIPRFSVSYGQVEGLPVEQAGTLYVVSALVRDAVAHQENGRLDLVSPGEQIRDAAGRVVGCKSLEF